MAYNTPHPDVAIAYASAVASLASALVGDDPEDIAALLLFATLTALHDKYHVSTADCIRPILDRLKTMIDEMYSRAGEIH